ncbi:major histocompatibility complex class I-related gene protein-like isoform X1 [Pantherophis guttatus]|uniref:Major histocompatibility complex class I-related gene protein-like isoform X1 n=1 Tax=Pantherophis guttatus TaxID=94885 RepID=A0ABM3ZM39_PANGU|nr:major histocompatibility complex class I-related gene protein-like isoform X1 [Pantherophis guttatus]XP_060549430.1 major histocompatibility complex class I-related gene protein-like isoform X1 [Pantherophis guttatus]
MELLVPWLEAEETKNLVVLERVFRADLEWLSNLSHQTAGLHTWQAILGCELREDGSKGGFLHYGYNGMDFISFDKETLRWVAAQPQAQKVKEMWEDDTRKSQRNKVYLEEMCIKMMQKYLSYQKKSLKKTEPPVGKVNYKIVDDSLEVLICQAFGFYPKEIQTIWTRDGEACKYGTLHRNVVPNSDGTYYVQLSIEIDPKERNHFRCHLEHEGLQEPLVLSFKEETELSDGTSCLRSFSAPFSRGGWAFVSYFRAIPFLQNYNIRTIAIRTCFLLPPFIFRRRRADCFGNCGRCGNCAYHDVESFVSLPGMPVEETQEQSVPGSGNLRIFHRSIFLPR